MKIFLKNMQMFLLIFIIIFYLKKNIYKKKDCKMMQHNQSTIQKMEKSDSRIEILLKNIMMGQIMS